MAIVSKDLPKELRDRPVRAKPVRSVPHAEESGERRSWPAKSDRIAAALFGVRDPVRARRRGALCVQADGHQRGRHRGHCRSRDQSVALFDLPQEGRVRGSNIAEAQHPVRIPLTRSLALVWARTHSYEDLPEPDEAAMQAARVERWKSNKGNKMESRWQSAVTYVGARSRPWHLPAANAHHALWGVRVPFTVSTRIRTWRRASPSGAPATLPSAGTSTLPVACLGCTCIGGAWSSAAGLTHPLGPSLSCARRGGDESSESTAATPTSPDRPVPKKIIKGDDWIAKMQYVFGTEGGAGGKRITVAMSGC